MYLPNVPATPICPRDSEEETVIKARQANRIRDFAANRAYDKRWTWRRQLLGESYDKQQAVLEAMQLADFPTSVTERTAACGDHVWVYRNNETHEHRVRHLTCHNRFCLMCQRTYIRSVKERALQSVPAPNRRISFLTLTQRAAHNRELQEAIANIVASFRRLRASEYWKHYVEGGLYVMEITRGTQDWWHVHLHAVIDTDFWPLDQLHRAWARASRDDASCHIEAVSAERHDAINRYLTQYLTKPFPDALYDNPAILAAFVAACRGRRMIQAFGSWAPQQLLRKAAAALARQRFSPDEWTFVGELHCIVDNAERGSRLDDAILSALGYGTLQYDLDAVSEIQRFHDSRAPPAQDAFHLHYATDS